MNTAQYYITSIEVRFLTTIKSRCGMFCALTVTWVHRAVTAVYLGLPVLHPSLWGRCQGSAMQSGAPRQTGRREWL
jgi:hypothetical protein